MTCILSVATALLICGVAYSHALDHWQKEMLQQENDSRAKHGSVKLEYNDELGKRAQRWAEELAKKCEKLTKESHMARDHPDIQYKDGRTGENIWRGTGPNNAVEGWYREIKDYPWDSDYHGQDIGKKVGHFTQVVWANTKEVGYGLAKADGCDRTYVVARYYPPGNRLSVEAYNKNVKKPI